ncbi:MAG: site-specific DNA-methyltransferase [Chthoniobacterales bacterium]|nr:site-specific DNA-methyltransferase [Chthoniobacterales bacterium]
METSGSTCFRSRAGGARTEAASLIAQTQFATLHGVVNQLYYGDNLQVLREHIADESVDLIYLDPPFNSKRDYNLLFKSPKGQASAAQIEAFEDTWHWNEQAEREFDELLHQPKTQVADMMRALRGFLGENDMMAYLTMMANRLLELHRALKLTGSLYLHCDPTASHYLKIVLDGVFGKMSFESEIVWKRTSSHGNVDRAFGDNTDTIFFYAKGPDYVWNQLYTNYSEKHLSEKFASVDESGRRFTTSDLRNPGVRPNLHYAFTASNGVTYEPHPNGWAVSREVMEQYDREGRLYFPKDPKGRMRLKRFLDETKGHKMQSLWDDIPPINSQAEERLGYPTQKPLALLERIIQASSNEGDVMLDPFCGCGTAVDAAHELKRKWIGIDITHLAISLIEKRLKDRYGARCKFEVHGTPKDLDGARNLAERDKYQFQWWAVSLVEAQPFQGKKKGADTGIDGVKFFRDLDRKEVRKLVVSVKGGGIKPDDVRSLNHVREREKAEIALFISLEQPTLAMVKDAASVGFYESATGKKFARVQLLTIEGLLNNTQRAEHPDYEPNLNFKKAKHESNDEQPQLI